MTSEDASHSEVEPLERPPFAESLKRIFRTRRGEPASRWRIRRYAVPVKFDEDNEREDRYLLHCLDKSVLRFRVNAVHRSLIFLPVSLAESLSELFQELLSVSAPSLSASLPVYLSVLHSVPRLWFLLVNI